MPDTTSLDSTSVTERLVLHELAELDRADRTPAQATDVLQACRGRLEELETVVGSRLTEGDLVRACRTLEDRGLVTGNRPERTSPVGKGRPAYELDVEVETVREFVSDDDRLSELPA
ncbi:hypothetical protein SAMN05216559_0204 [Halomicrobium zhouii]|uniref:Uncharacterized protein n=1 Tax=Halomicrobium zhouii TaxID=767519 RepID=A0A1I6K559_9EURY|nr:hypothetical protein [Halomicrobium zhouii]SFR86316.1 hypothetical protein SAMN05216559_0204 [Halomicrobium zhouii]